MLKPAFVIIPYDIKALVDSCFYPRLSRASERPVFPVYMNVFHERKLEKL